MCTFVVICTRNKNLFCGTAQIKTYDGHVKKNFTFQEFADKSLSPIVDLQRYDAEIFIRLLNCDKLFESFA